MIVEDLRTEEGDGALEHSARMRSADGERRLRFSVPVELSAAPGDGSPFLSACLLQAMRGGEDLEVGAPVSARLLDATDRVQTITAHGHRSCGGPPSESPARRWPARLRPATAASSPAAATRCTVRRRRAAGA